jgi:hypothetical protein
VQRHRAARIDEHQEPPPSADRAPGQAGTFKISAGKQKKLLVAIPAASRDRLKQANRDVAMAVFRYTPSGANATTKKMAITLAVR